MLGSALGRARYLCGPSGSAMRISDDKARDYATTNELSYTEKVEHMLVCARNYQSNMWYALF